MKIPLLYERAFGGQDFSPEKESDHTCDPRNLSGAGVIAKNSKEARVNMPNIEDPNNLIKSISDRPQPMGFGFIAPNWQPRLGFAGTCDEAWEKSRMPLLPKDFDRRFFSAGSPGLSLTGFLKGSEQIDLYNVTPNGRVSFYMPSQKPIATLAYASGDERLLSVELDSIIVNTDAQSLEMLWRTCEDVNSKLTEIEKVTITMGRVTTNATA